MEPPENFWRRCLSIWELLATFPLSNGNTLHSIQAIQFIRVRSGLSLSIDRKRNYKSDKIISIPVLLANEVTLIYLLLAMRGTLI